MITLDERARAAAEELRHEADRRSVPSVADLFDRPVPSRRPLLAVAAAVVLIVVAVAVLVGRDDGAVDVASVPDGVPQGVVPVEWSPGNLGVSLQVPEGWREAGPLSGFAHSMISGDGAYVLATLVLDHTDRSLGAFAAARRTELEGIGAEAGATTESDIDGHAAVEWSYRLAGTGGDATFDEVDVLEHVIDVGDRLRLIVAIGEPTPVDEQALRRWIGSTIAVGEPAVASPSVDHPAEVDPPAGVTPTLWTPQGVGVAMHIPADWTSDIGFDPGRLQARGGGETKPFVLAARLPAATGSPEARAVARQRDSEPQEAAGGEVDGHPTTITRYVVRLGGSATVQVEYVIDLGDGTFAVLTFGYPVTSPNDVTDWVRSTLQVTA